jgi:hypothetical protein
VRHGAHSQQSVGPIAAAAKRRLLRQLGLRASDLDGPGRAYLDLWARAAAKVALLDEHFDRAGLLDADGEPVPATRIYFTAANSARLALDRLTDHLRARDPARPLGELAERGRLVRLAAVADQ